jgi:hypothetical protein
VSERGRELAEAETPRLLLSMRKKAKNEVDNGVESDYKGVSVVVVSVQKSEEKIGKVIGGDQRVGNPREAE